MDSPLTATETDRDMELKEFSSAIPLPHSASPRHRELAAVWV